MGYVADAGRLRRGCAIRQGIIAIEKLILELGAKLVVERHIGLDDAQFDAFDVSGFAGQPPCAERAKPRQDRQRQDQRRARRPFRAKRRRRAAMATARTVRP